MKIFTPNTVIKSGELNANFDYLNPTKVVDANGWYKYKQGNVATYRKSGSWGTSTLGAGGWGAIEVSSNLPVGIANLGAVDFAKWGGSCQDAAISITQSQFDNTTTTIRLLWTNCYGGSVAAFGKWWVELIVVEV